MKTINFTAVILYLLMLIACKTNNTNQYKGTDPNIVISGRAEVQRDEVVLIGSASSATMYFAGDTCTLLLRNINNNGLYNFYSIELDNEDLGRFKIEGDSTIAVSIDISFQREVHKISIFKSTEAANQYIAFEGIICNKLHEPKKQAKYNIEFIGNSITCGMGNDTLPIPCHQNQWYDQHNAYWAYGPTVSRALKSNFILNSVSGIGMYRNWNDIGPIMPEVYNNLYLNLDVNKSYDFTSFTPDIVSICLGTNDLSDGDGLKERLPFNPELFTKNYIDFVENILTNYPETQIALLTSPMIKGEKHEYLLSCLQTVKRHFKNSKYKTFKIFQFENIVPHGCDSHPDINDHILMAEQLYPFYKNLLDQ